MTPVGPLGAIITATTPGGCANAPTMTSCTDSEVSWGTCPGGWTTRATVVVSDSDKLGSQYQLQYSIATDAAGTSWGDWGSPQTGLTKDYDHEIGTDGGGAETTVYVKFRAKVVDVIYGTDCTSWATSSQRSRTANSCFE